VRLDRQPLYVAILREPRGLRQSCRRSLTEQIGDLTTCRGEALDPTQLEDSNDLLVRHPREHPTKSRKQEQDQQK
jgi:hypothetical protein